MPEVTDKEFEEVIQKIVLIPRSKNSAITLTDMFKPITDKYTLVEFRDYLKNRFHMAHINGFYFSESVKRVTRDDNGALVIIDGVATHQATWNPSSDYFQIKDKALRGVNKRFYRDDLLALMFDYDKEGTSIVEFKSHLANEDMLGGVIGRTLLILAVPFAILLSPAYLLYLLVKKIKNQLIRH